VGRAAGLPGPVRRAQSGQVVGIDMSAALSLGAAARFTNRLRRAGLLDIRWHPLQGPPDVPEVTSAIGFYLANPSCIVLSATGPC
jgi:hypothetical protein